MCRATDKTAGLVGRVEEKLDRVRELMERGLWTMCTVRKTNSELSGSGCLSFPLERVFAGILHTADTLG